MKKKYFFIVVSCLLNMNCLFAADVLTLTTTDAIGATLNAYTGASSDVTVVIPAGYTSPEFTGATPSNIILTAIPSSIKNLVFQGDGTNPTILMKGFTFPPTLTSFTVQNLTLKGIEDVTTGTLTLGNYLAQSTGIITTVLVKNCTLANFRGVFRMNSGNEFTNLTIDGCIIRNIGNYNIINTATGAVLTNFTFKNSTVYGMNGNVFSISTIVPATVSIADCTFDNIGFVSGKYFIDFGMNNSTTALTISNTILGKTLTTGAKGIRGGTDYVYTVNNSYTTSDWITGSNNVVGFNPYENTANKLFKSPTTYDGTNATATVGDYTLLDVVIGNVGDPRWYINTDVKSVKSNLYPYWSDDNIVVNGVEIGSAVAVYTFNGHLIKKQTATSNKIVIPVKTNCILKISSNNESKVFKMMK